MCEAIKTAIKIMGTQKDLAVACGVSQQAVHKWVNGKSRVHPKLVNLIVNLTNGAVKPHEIRPDLPDLFPHPEGYSHASEPKHNDA
ncbi:TPA: helix-turn-helix domain-containing protein [Morganella morganii]|nr:helix-turn-helix domain-containing protein [Morganella morganii]HDF2362486.1 helix-turn-helix domain-containing protein [Morganella morganii]HDF2421712.1 helix-turn-helix domain-containing protein [Morganella morganii]